MIDPTVAEAFLAQRRIAVVGASDNPKSLGNAIYRAIRTHGCDAVPVNPNVAAVDGQPCFPDVGSVPGEVDGAIVMVPGDLVPDIVDECARKGVPRVWLFKGLGAPGSVSDEAVERCNQHGIEVIAGACPLMFLEPVGGAHKFHRLMRRLNGSVGKAA